MSKGGGARVGGSPAEPALGNLFFSTKNEGAEQCLTHFPAVGRNNDCVSATLPNFCNKKCITPLLKKSLSKKPATNALFDRILKFKIWKGEIYVENNGFYKKVESAAHQTKHQCSLVREPWHRDRLRSPGCSLTNISSDI